MKTQSIEERFNERFDKTIRSALFKAWRQGKEQHKTPYKYTLDTDKLGRPIFDMVIEKLKAQRQELKKKVEEGFDEMFGDSSIKLSTGQPLMQFKKNVNYYLVKDFIINLLEERKE